MDNVDEKLLSRIDDMIFTTNKRNVPLFSNFLDDGLVVLASRYFSKIGYTNYSFFGGDNCCIRKMLGIFPDFYSESDKEFPIKVVTAILPYGYKVSHGDVLGSLMGLKITRDSIGDIFVSEKSCVVFLRDSVFEVINNEWTKIGRIGIKLVEGFDPDLLKPPEFKEISGTVSSMRIDSVLSLSLGISRGKACDIIRSSSVKYNGRYVDKVRLLVEPGDQFSVKGYGKFKVYDQPRKTKKDRLSIKVHKYL